MKNREAILAQIKQLENTLQLLNTELQEVEYLVSVADMARYSTAWRELRSSLVKDLPVNKSFLNIRAAGEYKRKGFYLSIQNDWKIVRDRSGAYILVPSNLEVPDHD